MVQASHFLSTFEVSIFLCSRFFCKGQEPDLKIVFHEKLMQQATAVTLLSRLPQSLQKESERELIKQT